MLLERKSNGILSHVRCSIRSLFYRLLEAFKNSVLIDARVKEKAEKLEKRISVTDKFNLVYDEITRKKGDLDTNLAEVIEYNLNGIFNLIRLQRNESGHPTGTRPDKTKCSLILPFLSCIAKLFTNF